MSVRKFYGFYLERLFKLFSFFNLINFKNGGGGVKIFLEKWSYLHGALLGGLGACSLDNFFLNGAIWRIFYKKNGKNIFFFYRKILDNVLLRTFPTPPEKILTLLNLLNPPPIGKISQVPLPPSMKISQLSPKKILNPHPKISQPP